MKIVYIVLFSFYIINLYDSKVFGSTLQGVAEYVRRNLLFFLSDCTLGANKTRLLFFSRGISGIEVNLTTMELPINCSLKTIFIIHGFLSDGTKNWINDTVKALLKHEPLNVFSVDWQVGACSEKIDFLNVQSYRFATVNTKQVGEYVARCIKILVKNYHVSLTNIWMLGHSLGAHVCGFVGKHLQINQIGTLGRITGLDPAGPLFRKLNWTERLDRSDATFVDIIHTSHIFGLQEPVGHVDIFVNGGEFQPSCLLKKPGCSHDRAVDYYIEALKNPNCSFIGQKWSKRSWKSTKF
ncbi:probable phospholipase A1 magnifin isoform X2 [Cephus cinctus]|uniref:phospholipase A1 n=1 Tax=Cephus cinctus TaxID=211228 RepID=A0AAJ7BV71_CEPCN|nr:probable phospholipase A1 magnifin isoform X2 [Cephus cinctus]